LYPPFSIRVRDAPEISPLGVFALDAACPC
jgi:hypothetical protein